MRIEVLEDGTARGKLTIDIDMDLDMGMDMEPGANR